MTVLRKAYVSVVPDTDKFDDQLKTQLSKVKVDDVGDRIGKTFATGLTRRVDKQLKAFNLPVLDLKANPRDALAAIDSTTRRLKDLRDTAESVELRLRAESALGDLGRFRKQFGDNADEMGVEVGGRFGISTVRGMFAEVSAGFSNPPPQVYAGAAILGAALAPTLGAGIAAGVVGGAAAGGIIGGITLAARDPRVKAAGTILGQAMLSDLEGRSRGFVQPVLDGIGDIRVGFASVGDDLDRIFASSRFIDPLVRGVVTGAQRVIEGAADAVAAADPVVAQFSRSVTRIGDAVGDTFSLLAQDAGEGASALDDLTVAAENFVRTTGGIIHGLAQFKGELDRIDVGIDNLRYGIEDLPVGALGKQLDLTADGFKKGSAEAEAYRRITLGVGTAADEALVAQAQLAGKTGELSNAERAAAQSALEQAKAHQAEAAAAERAKTVTDALKVANQQLQFAQRGVKDTLDDLAPGYEQTSQLAQNLRSAMDRLYGATINQSEANESFEASWDSLSESVKANGKTLNVHTMAGRINRDTLQQLLKSNNDLYIANIEAGDSVDTARKKHEKRTEAVRKEAERVGLNDKQTDKLIRTYGRIPPAKTTDLILQGVKAIVNAMYDVYLFQRALAVGKTVEQIRGGLGKSAEAIKGRYAEGGWTGPGSKHQPAGVVHADEHVINKASRHSLESANPGGLDYMNRTGRWPGYAAGGTVAPVDTSRRMRFPVDISESFVMSKADARSRVTPAFSGGQSLNFMVSVIRQAFPGLGLISGYRPGSRTLSGSLSYHAVKRAVDYPPSEALAQFMYTNYKPQLKEAITPYQRYNVHNGSDHIYTGAVWNQHNFAGGNAHDHFAMDRGGYLQPGWNPPVYNGTGRREPVIPGGDIDGMKALLAELIGEVRSLVPGIAQEMAVTVGAGNYAAARRSDLYVRGG